MQETQVHLEAHPPPHHASPPRRRHDGQAVTCDDFRNAMAAANNVDLSHMERWYLQGGTPNLEVSCEYNESTKTFKLHCKQSTPPTPGQPTKARRCFRADSPR